jgi:hypothetical protein
MTPTKLPPGLPGRFTCAKENIMGTPLFIESLSQVRKSAAKWLSVLSVAALSAGLAQTAHADYPNARVTNNTEYTVSGKVEYVSWLCSDDSYSVAPGKTWTASSRGVCLIDDITGSTGGAIGKYGESTSITPYHASPATSYGSFQINAFSGSYRIFSADEWDKVSNTKQGKSPGFYFVNKTAWPLTYSLDQVGCLYHGIIPAGEGEKGVRRVDTGAVWFTLKIAIQPDGIDPVSNWDCVKPVAELVGDVAMAAVTGGGTAVAKAGGKVVVKQVAKEALKAGAKKAIKSAAKKVLTDLGKDELGKLLSDAGSVELYGQYAGYEWPFRCDNMPEYHIIGGPEPLKDEDGKIYLERGTPFKVIKVNDCGDDMMTGSKRSMESDQSSFSDWPGGGGNSLVETGDPTCVTFYTGTNAGGQYEQLCGVNDNSPITKDFSIPYRNKIKSFKCNSGLKSLLLLNLREPVKAYSCKGGNVINTDGNFQSATAAVFYTAPCCGEEPKPLTAAQQAARAQAAAKAAQEARVAAEAQAAAVTAERAAEQKALEDRVNAENAALEAGWAASARLLYGNCSHRGTVSSIESPGAVAEEIRIFNKGSKTIHIYWIDTQGQEVNYASQDEPVHTIASGPSGVTEYGAPNYLYIATDDNGECVGIGNGINFSGEFNFDPDLVVPGANPQKASTPSQTGSSEQGSYTDEDSGYEDTNVYNDDQSGNHDASNNVEGPGCEYFGQVASTDEGEIVDVRFENLTNDMLDLYWIDGNGQPSNYSEDDGTVASIPAQSFQNVRTRIGHIFVGVDSTGICLGMAAAETSGETIAYTPLQ